MHLETTPLFSLCRLAGAAIGLALASSSNESMPSGGSAARERSADSGNGPPVIQVILRALIGAAVSYGCVVAPKMFFSGKGDLTLLCATLAANATATYVVLGLVPAVARLMTFSSTVALTKEEIKKSATYYAKDEKKRK